MMSNWEASCWLSRVSRVCRPSWSLGKWGLCSRSCGGGEQTRQVGCVQRSSQTHVDDLADSGCAQPPPARRQACNTHSCPPVWTMGSWSQVRLHGNWSPTAVTYQKKSKKEDDNLNPSSDDFTTFYESDLSGFTTLQCSPREHPPVFCSLASSFSIVPVDWLHC